MKENATQKAMLECHYPPWERKLGRILKNRFGIGIVDCLDEFDLISSFKNGESTVSATMVGWSLPF
jgi:hypothetical protein